MDDDLSGGAATRIRESLDRRAAQVSPPAAFDHRIRRRVMMRAAISVGAGMTVAVASVVFALLITAQIRSEDRRIDRVPPAAPALPEGTLVFTSDMAIQRMDVPGGSPSEAHAPIRGFLYLDVSPDGSRAVYTVGSGPYESELWVVELSTGESKLIVRDAGTIIDPRWTPRGDGIVFIAETYGPDPSTPTFRIAMVTADGENLRDIADLPQGGVGLDVSPDGERAVYIANGRPDVFIIDLGSGRSTLVLSRADDVAWSPTDDRVAVQSGGSITLIDVGDPEPIVISSEELSSFDDFFELAWMSERWILFSGRKTEDADLNIYALDTESGDVEHVASTPGEDTAPSFAGGA